MDHKSLIALLLLSLLQETRGEDSIEDSSSLYGIRGGSVLIPGAEMEQPQHFVQWEFKRRTNTSIATSVVHYYIGSDPDVYEPYVERITFVKQNMSFVLHHLKKSDEGIYTMEWDHKNKRKVTLHVIDPVQKPVIQTDFGYNASVNVSMSCQGQEGVFYTWTKDRGTVSPESVRDQVVVLSGDRTSICGKYTCTVKNQLSSSQEEYHLLLFGFYWQDFAGILCGYTALVTEGLVILRLLQGVFFKQKSTCLGWISDKCSKVALIIVLFGSLVELQTSDHAAFAIPMAVLLSIILSVRMLLFLCTVKQRKRTNKDEQKTNKWRAGWKSVSWIVVICSSARLTVIYGKTYWICGEGSHLIWLIKKGCGGGGSG
nr:PREDICTED: uncharacterized protein LOC107076985 isoform X2 [Lepisosteus oculatus]